MNPVPHQKNGPQEIKQDVTFEFIDEDCGESHDLDSTLIYDTADPFAITIEFRNGVNKVRWTFGRDIFCDGIYEPTGEGDVHIWPCLSSGGEAVTVIELCSPDGQLLVQASSRELTDFRLKMLALVPDGQEANHFDMDAELKRAMQK